MSTYAELEDRKTELIRKALAGSCFGAPISADPITSLTEAGGSLATLPEGYGDYGWLSEEGMAFGRDVTQSDITSFGSTTPTRSDITADTTTLTIVAQETNLRTIGLNTGADMEGIVPDSSTGEVRIDKPDRPSARFYRVLALAVDESATGAEIYIARYLPRAKVTSYAAQNFASGDEAINWGVTWTGYIDSESGTSESWLFGGPGWLETLESMGWDSINGGGGGGD